MSPLFPVYKPHLQIVDVTFTPESGACIQYKRPRFTYRRRTKCTHCDRLDPVTQPVTRPLRFSPWTTVVDTGFSSLNYTLCKILIVLKGDIRRKIKYSFILVD